MRLFAAILMFVALMFSPAIAEEKDEDTACDKPVFMVVQGKNKDREKYRKYGEALRDSGIYPETGGYYMAELSPVEMFEGKWAEENFQVIVRFPCHQAARDMWFSDKYEAIKPLREGAGDVVVGIFPEVAVAPWATWALKDKAKE